MDLKILQAYKDSYNSFYFNELLKSRNYNDIIYQWEDTRLAELNDNLLLKDRIDLLTDYLSNIRCLMISIVQLYKTIDNSKINAFHLRKEELIDVLIGVENYTVNIDLNYEKDGFDLAIKIQDYFLRRFKECVRNMDTHFNIKIYESPLSTEFEKVRESLKVLINTEKEQSSINIKNKNNQPVDFENFSWFKVGLLFAKGKPQELYQKYKDERGHFKMITLELGFKKSDRPYFSETFNNSTKKMSDKNIYGSQKKLTKIYNYCIKNDISMVKDFITAYNDKQ